MEGSTREITLDEQSKAATRAQWKDLASRVKNAQATADEKSQIEVTSNDPGVGSALEEGKFVAVHGASGAIVGSDELKNGAVTSSKLADGSVTSTKIDWTTMKREALLLSYYNTSRLTTTGTDRFPLASGNITTRGGDLIIIGTLYGTLTGNIVYNDIAVDGTYTQVSSDNVSTTQFAHSFIYKLTDISAGTHKIEWFARVQRDTNVFELSSYTTSKCIVFEA